MYIFIVAIFSKELEVPKVAKYIVQTNENKENFFKNEQQALKSLNWYLNPITFYEEMTLIMFAYQQFIFKSGTNFQSIQVSLELQKNVFEAKFKANSQKLRYKIWFINRVLLLIETIIMDREYLKCDQTKLCFELLFQLSEEFIPAEKDYNSYFEKFRMHYSIQSNILEQQLVGIFIKILKQINTTKCPLNRLDFLKLKMKTEGVEFE